MNKAPIIEISTERKIYISIGILTLAILFGGVWLLSLQGAKEQEKLNKPLLGREIPIQTADHVGQGVSHPSYNSNPPVGGWMWKETAGAGIKDNEVADELLVHSMEHGAAVVHYKSDLPQNEVEKIKNAFNAVSSGKKIMVPRKNLDVPVALTSWGRLLKLSQIDGGKLKEFIETNSDRAPEKASI